MTIEDQKQARPALEQATARDIAAGHRGMPPDEAMGRARYLVGKGAVGLRSDGSVFVDPAHVDLVRTVACALLGETPAAAELAIDGKTKSARSRQREPILAARAAASRAPKPRLQAMVEERLAAAEAANPLMQGTSRRAKDLKARERERLNLEVQHEHGRPTGTLTFDGVS